MGFGDYFCALLELYRVRHAFGIPGVHTAELYRGLCGSGIRHITPRHEQGAGFMADGYARVSGRPGVCFVITGPGLTNIATAMAQAYADSVPLLVISAVNATRELGHGRGHLHELPDQGRLAAGLAAFSHTLLHPEELPEVLARAFAVFDSSRPRPVHIQIPTDVMQEVTPGLGRAAARRVRPMPQPGDLERAAQLLNRAERPIILAGGGARSASICNLLGSLDAPTVMTTNARGLLPPGHPLAVPASPSLAPVRALIEEADAVLAIGTELGPTDYDMYGRGGFSIPGKLVRIDIDPVQMVRNFVPEVPLIGDADATVEWLTRALENRECGGAKRAERARRGAWEALSPPMRRHVEFLNAIRDALPEAVIVGDSTQLVYAGNLFFEPALSQRWFNSATGYGALGYALPAAIGAKIALQTSAGPGEPHAPARPVVCLIGDGGLQFTLAELGSAIDAGAPVIVLVWDNRGYGEIKTYMEERGIAPEGVGLATPDFCAIAAAYSWSAERLEAFSDLARLLQEAAARPGPTLIEIEEQVVMR